MTDISEFIEHFGTKGMKWGVRRKATKAWLKEARNPEKGEEVIDAALKTMKPVMKKIKNDPMFKGKDLTLDKRLARDYDAVVSTIFNQHMAQASIKATYNPSLNRAVVYTLHRSTGMMSTSVVKAVEHAGVNGLPEFKVTFDSKGFVDDITLIESSISQSNVSDFIEHYGTKGMRWGVRSKSGSRTKGSSPTPKAKDLSDEDLKKAVGRMQMEKQYSTLIREGSRKEASTRVLGKIAGTVAKTAITAVATQQVNTALKKARISK